MKIQMITLALTFMTLAGAPPSTKPTAVKRITVDEVMALSVIAEYTDVEDMELAKVANSPRKTRDLLARMHTRRERAAWNRYEQLKAERDSRILTPPERWAYIDPMDREWQTWIRCSTAASKLRTLQFK